MINQLSLGIDIGGTNIAIALVDREGTIRNRKEYSSDTRTKESLFLTLTNGIDEVLKDLDESIENLVGFGLGIPGMVDVNNGVAVMQNNLPWADFPIVRKLREKYGEDLKITIDNDVKMAAYAEYKIDNLSEEDTFTYITLSTGIAATTIINNQILRGSGFSGEIGFDRIHTGENYQPLEKIAAGPAIQKYVQEELKDASITTKQVFKWYKEGNPVAKEAINRSIDAMVQSIHTLINVLDPKKIIFGGSVMYYNPFYLERLKSQLAVVLVDQQRHILERMSITPLGRDNGIIGAGLSVFK